MVETRESEAGSHDGNEACLVLVCGDTQASGDGLDVSRVSSRLQSNLVDVKVAVVENLCGRPDAVGGALESTSAQRLVIGICTGEFPEIEVHTQMRRHGVDPLGLQAVVIGRGHNSTATGPWATGRAELMLASAVARSRAFRGSKPENLRATLASSEARVSRRALFTLPPVSYQSAPTIATGMCAAGEGCSQCVDACPHDALSLDGDHVTVNRSQCKSCGICVAACPHRAVEFPGWSDREIEEQIAVLLTVESELEQRHVAFACRNAATPPGPWLPVKVPCAAAVPTAAILQALAGGATAVEIRSCGDKCPNSDPATLEGRVDYCRKLLQQLGDPSFEQRVQLVGAPEEEPRSTPDLPSLAGEPSKGGAQVFGRDASVLAVLALTDRTETGSLSLDHEHSPLGRIEIDEATCIGCGSCAFACPSGALTYDQAGETATVTFDGALCIACRRCEESCPERTAGAITMTPATDLDLLRAGPKTMYQTVQAKCERCGAPVAPKAMLDRIAAILGDDYSPRHMGGLCSDCRGR